MSAYCRQQRRQKNDKQIDVAQSNDKIYSKMALLNDLTLKIMGFLIAVPTLNTLLLLLYLFFSVNNYP